MFMGATVLIAVFCMALVVTAVVVLLVVLFRQDRRTKELAAQNPGYPAPPQYPQGPPPEQTPQAQQAHHNQQGQQGPAPVRHEPPPTQ